MYGGSDETGGISDPLYNGCFSATDAVIVAINYRLGPLGWLSLQRLGLSATLVCRTSSWVCNGSRTTLLPLAAIRWVVLRNSLPAIIVRDCALTAQQKKVLLFGQSAGAFDVFALASLPQAPSLMKAAAMQSGGGVDFATLDEAEKFNEQFVKNINCSETDVSPRSDGWIPPFFFFLFFFFPPLDADARCCNTALMSPSASVEQLNNTVVSMDLKSPPGLIDLLENMGKGISWGPVVDGKILPAQPSQVGVKVPSIFGSTTNDGSIFVLAAFLEAFSTSPRPVRHLPDGQLRAARVDGERDVRAVQVQRLPLSGFLGHDGHHHRRELPLPGSPWSRDCCGSRHPRLCLLVQPHASCEWLDDVPNTAETIELLGAAHTAEIPFVFGQLDNLPAPAGTAASTAPRKR